jgi:AmmeMemoRadiSam system protein A
MGYEHQLTDDEKRELLRIARATLREYSRTGHVPPGKPHRQSLIAPASVFVTLHRGDELRGCIGSLQDSTPLYKGIQEMAVAAATRDTRFENVPPDEIPELTIEISVLSARAVVSGPSELMVGEHGVCLTRGARRGLLLPQVAEDNGWDAETFLDRVCNKAGLPDGSWREDDATLEVFTAQVFDETQYPPKT